LYPVIGMTIDRDEQRCFLNHDYVQAIVQAGGMPLLIPYVTDPLTLQKYVDHCDGLLLTGGGDLDPRYFEQEPHPLLGTICPERDELELKVIALFLQQQKPVLAICRGCQLLNVAFGGDLYQDIASQTTSDINHDQCAPRGYPIHSITIQPNSLLASIVKVQRIRVNSYHHQVVKTVPEPLQVSAVADDGLIEAIESKEHRYVLGVQWHPEGMAIVQDKYAMQLFASFISACNS
jgi:putative glutamine amidotransferase